MPPIKSARDRARDEVTAEIVAEAHRQLATDGPTGLSLRSVARELGMVSSAIYRYFRSRDELLTALIVESYNTLGGAAEEAAGRPGTPTERWLATASAVREWALGHPHEYALLYGTPIPGYAAPDRTVGPGTRVTLTLAGIVSQAWDAGAIEPVGPPLDEPLAANLDVVAKAVDFSGPPSVLLATLTAWSQMFGLLTFELFNQTRGIADDPAALFGAATQRMAHQIGFTH